MVRFQSINPVMQRPGVGILISGVPLVDYLMDPGMEPARFFIQYIQGSGFLIEGDSVEFIFYPVPFCIACTIFTDIKCLMVRVG